MESPDGVEQGGGEPALVTAGAGAARRRRTSRAAWTVFDLLLVAAFAVWFYRPFMADGLPPGDFPSTVMVSAVGDILTPSLSSVTGWDPWSLCGRPTIAFTSPFWLLSLPLRGLPPIDKLKALLVIYHALAAMTMYGLLRGIGAGRSAAIFAGLVYPIMPSHVSRTAIHGNVQVPMFMALQPLLMLALFRLRAWSVRGVLLLGLAIAACLLRDGQRTVLFLFVLGMVLVPDLATGLVGLARRGRAALPHRGLQLMGALALASLIALLVNACDVIPDHVGDPYRSGWIEQEQDDFISRWSLRALYTVVDRDRALGTHLGEKGLDFYGSVSRYVGLSLLGLIAVGGLLGPAMGRHRRHFLVALAMLPVSLWLSFGVVPLWKDAAPRWRALFASQAVEPWLKVALAAALLAGGLLLFLGVLRHLPRWRFRLPLAALLTVGGTAAFLGHAPLGWLRKWVFLLRDLRNPDWIQVAVASFATCLAAALVVSALRARWRGRWWWPVACGLMIALALADFRPYRRFLTRFDERGGSPAALEAVYRLIGNQPEDARVMASERYNNLVDVGFIWHHKRMAAEFRSYLATARTRLLIEEIFATAALEPGGLRIAELAALANVRWFVDLLEFPADLEPSAGLRPKWRSGPFVIYENVLAKPFVHAWPEAHLLAGAARWEGVTLALRLSRSGRGLIHPDGPVDEEDLAHVTEVHALDPDRTPLPGGRVARRYSDGLPLQARVDFASPPTFTWTRPAPQRIHVEADLPAAGLVVVTESFHPWWKATLDGHDVRIRPANYAFIGVFVPEGHHVIELQFNLPWLYRASVVVSLASFLLLLTGLAWCFGRRRGAGVGEPLLSGP